METLKLLFLSLALALTAASNAATARSIPDHIHPLRPQLGTSAGRRIPGLNCLSWRLAVEADNIQDWTVVPKECENYVGNYMLGLQYRIDSKFVTGSAYLYAKNLTLGKDGKDVWVFDIDDTSLSNLPYYAQPDTAFGAKPYNDTTFTVWEKQAKAPALPATLWLYKRLLRLGFKIVFLTGRSETFRAVTVQNLHKVGYTKWEKLILKSAEEKAEGLHALQYKSRERTNLVKAGYRILGNIGDQWSDVLGDNVGSRTFKLPNPMFYIA
ncbi:hypothetical protein SAY86_017633 [Trapa natans]|uniref:Acid phosphatase n=1 Tax=Trapa natans TaxID=22666 RepID=A0AAN7LRM0_TRANT|nr:hypothetical protein SAY86_017633 [Trapa natans]